MLPFMMELAERVWRNFNYFPVVEVARPPFGDVCGVALSLPLNVCPRPLKLIQKPAAAGVRILINLPFRFPFLLSFLITPRWSPTDIKKFIHCKSDEAVRIWNVHRHHTLSQWRRLCEINWQKQQKNNSLLCWLSSHRVDMLRKYTCNTWNKKNKQHSSLLHFSIILRRTRSFIQLWVEENSIFHENTSTFLSTLCCLLLFFCEFHFKHGICCALCVRVDVEWSLCCVVVAGVFWWWFLKRDGRAATFPFKNTVQGFSDYTLTVRELAREI